MGNTTSFSIGVCTDGIIYATGSTVTGRVYLSVNSEEGVKASAMTLVLSGVEIACSAKGTTILRPTVNKAGFYQTHPIVNKTMSIASFQNSWIAQGHYEFPFQFQVPSRLPSTMLCLDIPDRCEVRYELEGHLILSPGSANLTRDSKIWIIKIAGGSPPPTAKSTVVIPTVHKGQMSLSGDIMTSGDGLRPGDSINVTVKYSSNESHARAAHIKVLLKEKVVWNNRLSMKKAILAVQHIETKSGQGSSRHEVTLEIPKTAHETYNGKHVNVTHKLTLQQLDSGILDLIQPHLKSTALVRILKCPRDPATAVAEFVRTEEPSVSPRDVLPENWSPQTANTVCVPFAECVEIVAPTRDVLPDNRRPKR